MLVPPSSNPFPRSSRFCVLILSGLFPRFSEVTLLPIKSLIWLLLPCYLASTAHTHSRRTFPCTSLASPVHVPSKEISPYSLSRPPVIEVNRAVVSQGDWKASFSRLLRIDISSSVSPFGGGIRCSLGCLCSCVLLNLP